MEEERDWSQALTDEDLVAIDAAVESATTSLNNKRRSSSSSSPYVEIQNDAVESDAIRIRRRRLQRSLVSTSTSNADVEIRNDAVESDPFRSRRRRLSRSIVALQNPNPVLSRCKAEAMRLPVMKFGGHILYSKTAIEVEQAAKGILTMIESKRDSGQFVLGLDIEWKASFRRGQ
jgi:hypothetical protein